MSINRADSSIWGEYKNLLPSQDPDKTSSALPLPFFNGAYLCRSTDGSPFFILPLKSESARNSFRLKYVRFDFDRWFEIVTDQQSFKSIYISIGCDNEAVDLHKFFIESISAILRASAAESSLELTDRLRDLFASVPEASTKSARGLFGELFYLRHCGCVKEAVQAWHRSETALYDFEFSNKSVEIKTTGGNARVHSFSLSQLQHAKECDELISIMLHAGDLGVTAEELIEEIASLLDPRALSVFYEKLLPILGSHLINLDEEAFVVSTTLKSTCIIPLCKLRCPDTAVSGIGEIIGLKVTLDLSKEAGRSLA